MHRYFLIFCNPAEQGDYNGNCDTKDGLRIPGVYGESGDRRYFISDVLDMPAEQIKETRLGNTFLRRRFRRQKQGILDVKVHLQDGTRINIEMQFRRQKFWKKRSLYYLAKMYSDVLFVGEDYHKLRRCVSIHILDFNLTDEDEYHSVYRMRNELGKDYSDLLELHTIELRKQLSGNTRIDDWITHSIISVCQFSDFILHRICSVPSQIRAAIL